MFFPVLQREALVQRNDERNGRLALADDAKEAIMMGMCLVELERQGVLNSDRYETYQNVKSAIRDIAEHMRRKYDPMGIDAMAHPAQGETEVEPGRGSCLG